MQSLWQKRGRQLAITGGWTITYALVFLACGTRLFSLLAIKKIRQTQRNRPLNSQS
jgi:hypothetical protein